MYLLKDFTMKKLICASVALICSLFATSCSLADIVVTLSDAGAAGVTATFSNGTGNWNSGQPNMAFGDTTDSFLANGQGTVLSSGTIPLGINFGGITGIDGTNSGYRDFGGVLGLQSLIQLGFSEPLASGPTGDPAMSELDGVSVTLPGWDFADFTPGTYTGLTGVGGVDGQSITLNIIPEPTAPLALLAGATVFGFVRRKRRK